MGLDYFRLLDLDTYPSHFCSSPFLDMNRNKSPFWSPLFGSWSSDVLFPLLDLHGLFTHSAQSLKAQFSIHTYHMDTTNINEIFYLVR